MKTKKTISIIAIAALTVSLMGCSPIEGLQEWRQSNVKVGIVDPADSNGKVGIALPSEDMERWVKDATILENHFAEAGYTTYLTFSDYKVDQQINDIKSLINEGVDLLIVTAVDSGSLSEALEPAEEANIPVICYDRLVMKSDAVSYYVSYDNYTVGKMQGLYVKEQLDLDNIDGSVNVEFVAGDSQDSNSRPVFNGAYSVLSRYIDSGKVKVRSGQTTFDQVSTAKWDAGNANNRMRNILGSFYSDGNRLDAVICSNDTTAMGVVQAIDSDYTGENHVIITGQDGDEPNLNYITEGKQSMTVYKPSENEALVTYTVAMKVLNGEKPDIELTRDNDWDFDCVYDMYSFSNGLKVVPSYLLSPVVITRDNMVSELSEAGN